jgi:hypothetical protein
MNNVLKKWVKRVWQSTKRRPPAPHNPNGNKKRSPVDGLILYMSTMYQYTLNIPFTRYPEEDNHKRH